MAVCNIADIKILSEQDEKGESLPARVTDDLRFEVVLDVAEPLMQDVVFRVMYVVDASDPSKDVELESADIGAPGLPKGVMKFTLEASAPSRSTIEAGGGPFEVTGLYLSATYKAEEFCRVGYYVRHDYENPSLTENPPETIEWSKLIRALSEPCVTKFLNAWDGPPLDLSSTEASAMDVLSG
ncbi:unnamed protein product [Polarella glacialis]|uniref:Uncharacterized protein n=2 Tax=Polarella glacialis TaxID=89957 RepID=A0A813DST5_POLGL|nr:unnamed protein product [Polarella glacialis]